MSDIERKLYEKKIKEQDREIKALTAKLEIAEKYHNTYKSICAEMKHTKTSYERELKKIKKLEKEYQKLLEDMNNYHAQQ